MFSWAGFSLALQSSLRASSPIWVSEPAPRGFAARSRVLARLASLAQIGELARRLITISRLQKRRKFKI